VIVPFTSTPHPQPGKQTQAYLFFEDIILRLLCFRSFPFLYRPLLFTSFGFPYFSMYFGLCFVFPSLPPSLPALSLFFFICLPIFLFVTMHLCLSFGAFLYMYLPVCAPTFLPFSLKTPAPLSTSMFKV